MPHPSRLLPPQLGEPGVVSGHLIGSPVWLAVSDEKEVHAHKSMRCGFVWRPQYDGVVARPPLVEHLTANALRTDGPFTLRSGAVSDWYVDARQTTFDGEGARLVGQAVLSVLRPEVEAVGGMTMGADPIAVATAVAAAAQGRSLKAFSIRKEEKDHGTGGRIVGPVDTSMPVAVMEDTTTTGGAAVEAARYLLDQGYRIVQSVVLVDRSSGRAAANFAELGIDHVALVVPADLGVVGS